MNKIAAAAAVAVGGGGGAAAVAVDGGGGGGEENLDEDGGGCGPAFWEFKMRVEEETTCPLDPRRADAGFSLRRLMRVQSSSNIMKREKRWQ